MHIRILPFVSLKAVLIIFLISRILFLKLYAQNT
nr:MAG TPA: hypothetical protein [Caudoviricetes sp.]